MPGYYFPIYAISLFLCGDREFLYEISLPLPSSATSTRRSYKHRPLRGWSQTPYSFTITARNKVGDSKPSVPSRPVAPAAWLEWRKEAALELKEGNEKDDEELEELFAEADDIEDALMLSYGGLESYGCE